jgi:hypothetical protein
MLSSLNTDKFWILYYSKFLDERCDIQKNYCLVDGYILKDVGVMYAPLVSYITVF